MESYELLDPKDEEELFKARLLNVEERPFKRITKRLATLHSLATTRLRQELTPPPETPAEATEAEPDLAQLREDLTLDFAAFDASIARLQFLRSANEGERARYAEDREHILAKSTAVREETTRLRSRLETARDTLAQRRVFDELAERITSNRLLRPRADQELALERLEEECAQLEGESAAYGATWRERRDQFARIMEESMRLRRLIRDEKEEVERREGMDEGEAAEGPAGDSGHATPMPDSGMLPRMVNLVAGEDAGTPRPGSTFGGRTPARESPGPDSQGESLRPASAVAGGFSRSGSRAASREGTPAKVDTSPEEGEDVEMGEASGTTDSAPVIVLDSLGESQEKMDTT
jgi:hypothetical protein